MVRDVGEKDQLVRHNLHSIPERATALLMREGLMSRLLQLITGSGQFGRASGCVLLYGYGGVGKTALAAELCYELLRRVQNRGISGYSFILWLSSKEKELRSNPATGGLCIGQVTPDYRNAWMCGGA